MSSIANLMRHVEGRHGIVTLDELLEASVGERQVARWVAQGRLVPEERAVYRVAGCPPSNEAQALAAVVVHGSDTWASHHTAAALWSIPGFHWQSQLHVLRSDGLSNQRAGARVHRSNTIPEHHVTVLRQIPITTVPRTLFDVARSTGPRRLDRAIRGAVRERLCTVGGIYRVFHELGGRGRPGTRRLRAVLDTIGQDYVPTDSELDEAGRAALHGISGIEWQVPMSDERGHIRTVDGLHGSARIVIEFDGVAWHSSPEQVAWDLAGDERLHDLGFTVERFGWVDVTVRAELTRARVARLIDGLSP